MTGDWRRDGTPRRRRLLMASLHARVSRHWRSGGRRREVGGSGEPRHERDRGTTGRARKTSLYGIYVTVYTTAPPGGTLLWGRLDIWARGMVCPQGAKAGRYQRLSTKESLTYVLYIASKSLYSVCDAQK